MSDEKKFLKDRVATRIFRDEACRDYVKAIICKSLDIDDNAISTLELIDPNVSANINVRNGITDAAFKVNDGKLIVNLEINYSEGNNTKVKNFTYLCHLFLREQHINKNVKDVNLIQININNYDPFRENKFIYRSILKEEASNKVRYDYFKVIDINIDYLTNLDYNTIKEEPDSLATLLYIFVCDDNNKLNKLYWENKIMTEVRGRLKTLTEGFDDILYYNPEELRAMDSYDSGKEDGSKEERIKIAKTMIKMNLEKNTIMQATSLTEEEYENIINEES